jgi:hypothetical protein
VRTVTLSLAGSLGFALAESYVHWRAGLGFHGLSCLLGPVHRSALPILGALALLAAALGEAVQHLRAWGRATARELLRPRLALPARRRPVAADPLPLFPTLLLRLARSRAPPLPAWPR